MTAASAAPVRDDSSSSSSSQAPLPRASSATAAGVPFVLYALRGRVYASNVKDKLIDLGALAQQGDGTWSYLLDGDQATGSGFEGPEDALAHVAATTTFLFLDGQFTALEDLGGTDRPDLRQAPQCDVALDPLGRVERVIGAPV